MCWPCGTRSARETAAMSDGRAPPRANPACRTCARRVHRMQRALGSFCERASGSLRNIPSCLAQSLSSLRRALSPKRLFISWLHLFHLFIEQASAIFFKSLGVLYDWFNLGIGLADVISDVLIVWSYYESGYTGFFWTAVVLLVLASVRASRDGFTGLSIFPHTSRVVFLFFCLLGGHRRCTRFNSFNCSCLRAPHFAKVPRGLWCYYRSVSSCRR